jgi:hypothetical protein
MFSTVTSQGRRRRRSMHRLVLLRSDVISTEVPLSGEGQMTGDT